MPTAFLDTSALVKRYHLEAGSAAVDRLFDGGDRSMAISRLATIEFRSALAARVRAGELDHAAFSLAIQRFEADIRNRRLLVVRMLVGHFRVAEELIGRHATTRRLRALDALQLAVVRLEGLDAFDPLDA